MRRRLTYHIHVFVNGSPLAPECPAKIKLKNRQKPPLKHNSKAKEAKEVHIFICSLTANSTSGAFQWIRPLFANIFHHKYRLDFI